MFLNRAQAGQMLAKKLTAYKNQDCLVLALPRGGLPVAYEIAKKLNCPLDILIVRKLGAPGNSELAIGAVAETGAVLLNQEVIKMYRIPQNYLDEEIERQKQKIKDYQKKFRERQSEFQKNLPNILNKCIILIDDGAATGFTMKAAVMALKYDQTKTGNQPSLSVKKELPKIIIALPVCSREAYRDFQKIADEVVILEIPSPFYAVGNFYQDFQQVEDEEVIDILRKV